MEKGFAADQKRTKKKVTRDWAAGFPVDLLANIFSRLETADLLRNAQWVCKSWRNASKIPFAFQSIRLKSCYPSDRSSESRVFGLFAEDARRSNGHLTEIDISSRSFSDKLLKLVTSRYSIDRYSSLLADLRGCYNLFPDEESASRWRKRVRNLVLPEDAEEDHDFDCDFEFDCFDDGGDYDEFGAYEYY